MSFINWGSESPEQLAIRRQIEEQALYEQAVRATRARSRAGNTPGAAAGGGGYTGVSVDANFAALFSLYEGLTTYAQSATSDVAGNIFTLSSVVTEGDKNNVLRKITSTGVIVWEMIVEASDIDSDITPSRIRLSPDGHLYVVVNAGISKHATEDGTLLWEYLVNTSVTNTEMISVAFLSDGTPVTLSDLDDGSETSLLCTWNKTTGAKLTEKQFDLELGNQYSHADILIDSDDNVIMALDYTDGGYGDNYEAVTKVEVVNAYKTESYALKGVKIIELAIIIYINTIIDTFDAGDYLWDFKLNLETYLGKSNFRIKLLNVINENW